MSNRKRIQLVDKLLERIFLFSDNKKPGVVIKKLSAEDRKVCETLTHKDFSHRFGSVM